VISSADVVATQNSDLIQIPAQSLRALMSNPILSDLLLKKMTERLVRTSLNDLPRFSGVDQQDAKELRKAASE
jgi:CRP-like cAMP-binding protein